MSAKNIIEERKKYWLEKIAEWKSSKKTALSWCKANNINPKTFYNQRAILKNNRLAEITKDSFIELSQRSQSFELEVEYKKYKFKLKDADGTILQNFITLIKRL